MTLELDPFSKVYNELWALANASAPLTSVVKLKNQIRFDSDANRDPIKDVVAVADLPELVLTTMGVQQMNMHSSTCGTSIQRTYTWLLATGDFRIRKFLYPVQFALLCSMMDYGTKLRALTWNGKPFVVKADLAELSEGVSNPELNRGITGWSSLWTITVSMIFQTSDLIAFNLET